MAQEYLFSQDGRYLAFKRRKMFLTAGVMPVLIAFLFMTWAWGRSGQLIGMQPSDTAFVMPTVLAVQLLMLWRHWPLRYQATVRLSSEALFLTRGHMETRHPLTELHMMKVLRDPEKEVHTLVLHFRPSSQPKCGRKTIRLEGYLEMQTLRDLLVRYAGTPHDSRLQVMDPVGG